MHIEARASQLSSAIQKELKARRPDDRYSHGLHGIFNPACEPAGLDPWSVVHAAWIDPGSRPSGQTDKQVKTRFLHRQLCQRARPIARICEVGFMAGHTSLLFLESVPGVQVVSFDLGDNQWTAVAASLLHDAYGFDRFEIVIGSSLQTVPRYHRTHSNVTCDVVLIDGAKDFASRLLDLTNFQHLSSPRAMLLFYEVCSLDCAQHAGPSCLTTSTKGAQPCYERWGGASKAYGTASDLQMINVTACDFPPGFKPHDRRPDGSCRAEYVV